MDALEKSISVVTPVNEAIEKTRILLFKPFDMEKWLIIGFCAWLANLLRAGSGGGGGGGSGEKNPQAAQAMASALEFARNHIIAISISVTLAVIFLAIILILLMWLSSRGQFMFLDCLAKNKAEVRNPWKIFKQRANSLLGFRLLMIAIGFAVMIIVGIPTGFIIIAAKSSAFSLAAAVVMIFFAITPAATSPTVSVLRSGFRAALRKAKRNRLPRPTATAGPVAPLLSRIHTNDKLAANTSEAAAKNAMA